MINRQIIDIAMLWRMYDNETFGGDFSLQQHARKQFIEHHCQRDSN